MENGKIFWQQTCVFFWFCHHWLRLYVIFVSLIWACYCGEWFGLGEYVRSVLGGFESKYLAGQNREWNDCNQ